MAGLARRTILALAAIGVSIAASTSAQELPSGHGAVAPPAVSLPADAPAVAIMEFDFGAVHHWWAIDLEIGRGIADLFTDGLVNHGGYRVVERRFLQSILAEQKVTADSERSNPTAGDLIRAGQLVGARYLVVGSVIRFGTESETARGGGGILGRAFGLGVIGRQRGKAVVGLTARLVDVATGVVVLSATSEATSSRSGLLLGGLTMSGFAGFSMRSSEFRETILGEATERAVRQLVEQFVAAKPRIARQRDVRPPYYEVLGAGFLGRRSVLQQALDEASTKGYRLVGAFDLDRVLLRKTYDDERYVHVVTKSRDTESLEYEMNAAAAAGFRLMPDAALSSPWLAVMNRRVRAPIERLEYRVRVFETDYGIDGFQADAIDEQLAEMAVAGYRFVALATQDVDVRRSRASVRQLVLFFEKEAGISAAASARAAARRYHTVIASTEGEFEVALNRAARAGYRLLTTAASAFREMIGVVEKDDTASHRTYAVFTAGRSSTLSDDLSLAAAAGWRVHPRGVLNPLVPILAGLPEDRLDKRRVLFVLERDRVRARGSMLVVDAMRASTLARELNTAATRGFRLMALGAVHGEMLVVLGRPS